MVFTVNMYLGDLMMTSTEPDELVRTFVSSDDATESERALAELLSAHAGPLVRRIVSYKLADAGISERQDIEDLCGEVLSDLLHQLRQVKGDRTRRGIQNFNSYTSVTTYRAFSDYLRQKYPHRHRLKTQLRYLLQADGRLAIWESAQYAWLCGLSRWDAAVKDSRKLPTAEEVRELSAELAGSKAVSRPADFVVKLLARLAAPIELDDLVSIVGDFWGIGNHTKVNLDENDATQMKHGATVASCLELKDWLARLWLEVCELPVPQRNALLLNLRDEYGGSALMLVPQAGIASVSQIAGILEMPDTELASMWSQLPIDDLTIGQRLGLTRQQIINLRKSARARLVRRMAPLT